MKTAIVAINTLGVNKKCVNKKCFNPLTAGAEYIRFLFGRSKTQPQVVENLNKITWQEKG